MRFSFAFMPPTSSVTLTPNGSSRSASVAACWRAKISVGGQHGALPAVLRGKPDGRGGHQRFAAADVALQKAGSSARRRRDRPEFPRWSAFCAPVGGYGRLRQNGPRSSGCMGGAGLAPPVAAQQEDADLEQVQLLKNQPPPPRQGRPRFGRVDAPHGLRLGGHPVAGQQLGRQRVHKLVRERQRCMGTAGVAAGGQTVGAGIDRHKRAVSDLSLGAYQRVQQLAAGQRPADAPLKVVVGLPPLPACPPRRGALNHDSARMPESSAASTRFATRPPLTRRAGSFAVR